MSLSKPNPPRRPAFTKARFVWGALLLFLLALVGWRATTLLPKEQQKYDRISESMKEKHLARKNGEEKRTSMQERQDVQKRIWLSEKEPRLELELKAKQSQVGLTMVKSQGHLRETFQDVKGMCQEELFYKDSTGQEYTIGENGVLQKRGESLEALSSSPLFHSELIPMQRFRYFESEDAVYDYHTHTLVANNAKFWTYIIPGHTLVASTDDLVPEASGSCASMTLCHLGTLGSVQFSAEQLQMQVAPKW